MMTDAGGTTVGSEQTFAAEAEDDLLDYDNASSMDADAEYALQVLGLSGNMKDGNLTGGIKSGRFTWGFRRCQWEFALERMYIKFQEGERSWKSPCLSLEGDCRVFNSADDDWDVVPRGFDTNSRGRRLAE